MTQLVTERKFKYKFHMYRELEKQKAQIFADARKAADEIGIPSDLRGKFGLSGSISGCPGLLTTEVIKAIEGVNRKVISLSTLVEQIREIVKDVYGDKYDAAPINTCEAALWVSFDTLCTPPMQGRGTNYRCRYLAPLERHLHHHGAYGRPFPPKYKDMFADRGVTAGELGFYGKRLENLDTVMVPLVGAKYEAHGIKYYPVPLLLDVDAAASAEELATVAERHASTLTGFSSLGADTPGYGYGEKVNGSPKLQKLIGDLAHEYNVPYITDNAHAVPFIGTDLRKTGADIIAFSMDKSLPCPTSGLIIGTEEALVPVRRALGMHGERWGTGTSYGKAAYVTQDPGKQALAGQIAILKQLRDNPDDIRRPIDDLYKLTVDEFSRIDSRLRDDIEISKTYNAGDVEINYEKTWRDGKLGFPIFSIEDMYSGTSLLQSGVRQMGVIPCIAYDGQVIVSPGLGTIDENGQVVEETTRYMLKALVKMMEIVGKYAGTLQ